MVKKSVFTEVSELQAEDLTAPVRPVSAVEVKPSRLGDHPATIERFLHSILELQTGFLGVKNKSPVVSYEIQRPRNDRVRIQFVVPSKRLDRKVRNQLSNQIPGVDFEPGVTGLPVRPEDSIGGGILTTGRKDRYPLNTEFDSPPTNGVVSALHRHAMRDSRFVIQILFQPVVGKSVKQWWRKNRSYKTAKYLRKDKQQVWGEQRPTPRERKQADAVEAKTSQLRFWVSIRFAVIGAGEYTGSRVKEVGGAFNVFGNPETGQYLDIHTITGRRQKPFLGLFKAVHRRRFGGYSLKFQATTEELAGLLSIPDLEQENLEKGQR